MFYSYKNGEKRLALVKGSCLNDLQFRCSKYRASGAGAIPAVPRPRVLGLETLIKVNLFQFSTINIRQSAVPKRGGMEGIYPPQ